MASISLSLTASLEDIAHAIVNSRLTNNDIVNFVALIDDLCGDWDLARALGTYVEGELAQMPSED